MSDDGFRLGSSPAFPAGSKTRGMARAVLIVDWMVRWSLARSRECRGAGRTVAADVFADQAQHYKTVADTLRREMR